jgi:hypothetical protein
VIADHPIVPKEDPMLNTRLIRAAGLALAAAIIAAPPAAGDALAPVDAQSYINRETGGTFENPNVMEGSDCESPDRLDRQPLSDPASGNPGNRNVHNDACLFGELGLPFDGPVTYESRGVGYISACPDPDMTAVANGPKTAVLEDTNGDGRNDRCRQSGYQTKGAAGDGEYHARLNNSSTPGGQMVRFCFDPDQDGCLDEAVFDGIRIRWVLPG